MSRRASEREENRDTHTLLMSILSASISAAACERAAMFVCDEEAPTKSARAWTDACEWIRANGDSPIGPEYRLNECVVRRDVHVRLRHADGDVPAQLPRGPGHKSTALSRATEASIFKES